MRPAIVNVIEDIPGEDIVLAKTKHFIDKKVRKYSLKDIVYFYDMVEWLHFRDIVRGINSLKKENSNEKSDKPPTISNARANTLRIIDGIKYYIKKHRIK